MRRMRVIGTVGLPGSGKSEAAAAARERGVPVVTMGDVIRAECEDRGLEITEANMGEVADDLREEGGPAAVAERSLPLIRKVADNQDADTVLVDGIRSGAEVDHFEAEFGDDFILVHVEVPFGTRLERIRERGRDTTAESEADLRERDQRELGYGMDEAIERADVTVENTGSIENFHDRIHTLIEWGPEALDEQ